MSNWLRADDDAGLSRYRLTVLRSDGFDVLTARFEVIIFDAVGAGDRAQRVMFSCLDDQLAEQGRVLINAALTDDHSAVLELISDHDLDRTSVAQRTIARGSCRLTYAVFRLTRTDSPGRAMPRLVA